MYKLCRLMLIATVLVVCESLVAFATSAGGLGYLGIAIFLIASLAKRGYGRLSAFGTARWADAEDLRARGMLGARTGLIIGRVMDAGKRRLAKAVPQLFDPTVSSQQACEEFQNRFPDHGAGLKVYAEVVLKFLEIKFEDVFA